MSGNTNAEGAKVRGGIVPGREDGVVVVWGKANAEGAKGAKVRGGIFAGGTAGVSTGYYEGAVMVWSS